MDYEAIQGALQTIEIAKLFYDYGKLDRLLENGVTCTVEDPTFYFYEYWAAAADYVDLDFDDNHDVDHWYFSFRSMVEYYRLCRDYSTLHGIKLRKNPYVKKAEAMLADAFYNCSCSGGLGWGYLANDALFVCLGGVSAHKGICETLQALGVTEVMEAMDMDQFTKPEVWRSVLCLRSEVQRIPGIRYYQCTWDRQFKGVDDYLFNWTKRKTA